MADLVHAIWVSNDQAAVCRTRDGTIVQVQRITGLPGVSDNEDEYVVRVQRSGGEARDEIATVDLSEALGRMRSLDIPGFDPETAEWEPSTHGGRRAAFQRRSLWRR